MPPEINSLDRIHYIVTIAGVYYTQEEKGKNMHPYSIDVPFTHTQLQDPKESALSLFRHNYAHRMMPKKYPDYVGLSTHEVKKVKCSEPSRLLENIRLMNLSQLCNYVEVNGLPVITNLYEDAGSVRAAIESFRKDPDGFLKTQKIAEQRKGPQLLKQSAADLLLEQYGDDFVTGSIEPHSTTRVVRVASSSSSRIAGNQTASSQDALDEV